MELNFRASTAIELMDQAHTTFPAHLLPLFITDALSKEQYEWLKQAIANWRALQKTLRQMQHLSREELFDSVPGPQRRKKLSKKVLGLV